MTKSILAAMFLMCASSLSAQAQTIQPPSIESVKEDLKSDDSTRIVQALVLVRIYQLPIAGDVQAFFDSEHGGDAFMAFLAAGGDEDVLVARLKQAEAARDDYQRFPLEKALLFSESHRELGMQTLIDLLFEGDFDALDVLKSMGGELSAQAMHQVLEEIASMQALDVIIEDIELFPLGTQMRMEHWPDLIPLLEHSSERIRFLGAHWALYGDFDDVETAEVEKLFKSDDPILRGVAATLLVRQDRNHAAAVQELRKLLKADNSLGRQVALTGVHTFTRATSDWLPLVMLSLGDEDRVLNEAAERVILDIAEDDPEGVARFLMENVDRISTEDLFTVGMKIDQDEQSEVVQSMWEQFRQHNDEDVRGLANTQRGIDVLGSEAADEFGEWIRSSSADDQEVGLGELLMYDDLGDAKAKLLARAKELLSDDGKDGTSSTVQVAAARLLWKHNEARSEILELAKVSLTSDKSEGISNGMDLMRVLGKHAEPLVPLAFDAACRDWGDREHLRHLLGILQPGVRRFLLEQLKSTKAEYRGTALELLLSFPPDEPMLDACFALLDDSATYDVDEAFQPVVTQPVKETAANVLAYWALQEFSLAQRIQSDEERFAELKVLLGPQRLKWITHPRPGFEQIQQGVVQPSYWDVGRVLSETNWSVCCFTTRKENSAGRASTELLSEYLALAERAAPLMLGAIEFAPLYVFEDLESKQSLDDVLIAALEDWVADVPLLDVEIRTQAALTLLHFRPDNLAARTFLWTRRRDMEMYWYQFD